MTTPTTPLSPEATRATTLTAANYLRSAATNVLPYIASSSSKAQMEETTETAVRLLNMSKAVFNISMQMAEHQRNIIDNVRNYTTELSARHVFPGQGLAVADMIKSVRLLENWYPQYWNRV